MSSADNMTLVVVDWGTSHLRIWAIDRAGNVMGEKKSAEGMASTPRDRFQTVLEHHLSEMAVGKGVPVIMCGMVGSRQGWAEAGYIPVPAGLDQLAARAVRVPHEWRDIRILPGLSKPDPSAPDVVRGEETQLLGLLDVLTPTSATTRIACMPGTHSKWVSLANGRVEGFISFITGDMFSALSSHSVLSHSVGDRLFDAGSDDFRQAVAASLETPADILARLFSIRPAGLLFGLPAEIASARLSGYLIGQEIAGAKARLSVGQSVELIGGGTLGELYRAALGVASIDCVQHNGDALVIRGACKTAKAIWNLEISESAGS